MTSSTILANWLDPVITPEVARHLIAIKADEQLTGRILELGAKASAGTLSQAEEEEYDAHIEANDIVAILQAKARKVLGHGRP
jgi:hypothetical protein